VRDDERLLAPRVEKRHAIVAVQLALGSEQHAVGGTGHLDGQKLVLVDAHDHPFQCRGVEAALAHQGGDVCARHTAAPREPQALASSGRQRERALAHLAPPSASGPAAS